MDEEVEIAVNLALERFRYGEDTGAWGSGAERGGQAAGPADSAGREHLGRPRRSGVVVSRTVLGDSAATSPGVRSKRGVFGN